MRGYRIEGNLNNAMDSLGNIPGGIQQQAERLGLNAQVEQRPWLVLGAAVAAGYLLGNLFGDGDSSDRDRDRDYQDRSYTSGASRTNDRSMPSPSFYTDHPSSAAVAAPSPAASASPTSNAGYGGSSNYGAPSSSHSEASSIPSPSTAARPASYSVAPSNAPSPASSSGSALASTASSVASSAGSLLSSVVGDPNTIKAQATDMIRSVLRDTIRENIPQVRDQIDELERRKPRQS